MKSIIFAGTSITWGEGLHFYSDLPNINTDRRFYNSNDYTDEHLKFIQENRFSRLVAKELNMIDIVRKSNGGTNQIVIDYIQNEADLSNCEYIIIQFTDPFRDLIEFNYKGENRIVNITLKDEVAKTEFIEFIRDEWNFSLEDYIETLLTSKVKHVESVIKDIENKGVKRCFILNEKNDLFYHFQINPFFKDRLIQIKIDNFVFNTIEDALFGKRGFYELEKGNKLVNIKDDPYIIKKYNKVIHNLHLSLDAQKILAKSILEKINNL